MMVFTNDMFSDNSFHFFSFHSVTFGSLSLLFGISRKHDPNKYIFNGIFFRAELVIAFQIPQLFYLRIAIIIKDM